MLLRWRLISSASLQINALCEAYVTEPEVQYVIWFGRIQCRVSGDDIARPTDSFQTVLANAARYGIFILQSEVWVTTCDVLVSLWNSPISSLNRTQRDYCHGHLFFFFFFFFCLNLIWLQLFNYKYCSLTDLLKSNLWREKNTPAAPPRNSRNSDTLWCKSASLDQSRDLKLPRRKSPPRSHNPAACQLPSPSARCHGLLGCHLNSDTERERHSS